MLQLLQFAFNVRLGVCSYTVHLVTKSDLTSSCLVHDAEQSKQGK